MTFIFKLPARLDECPEFWQNFVFHHNPYGDDGQMIDVVLKNEYAAIFLNHDNSVEFKTKNDFLMFRLRWE